MKEEIWRDIENYEGLYQVSNLGRVRSVDRIIKTKSDTRFYKGKILSPSNNGRGYFYVSLGCGSKHYYIHRLVAKTFIPNPLNLPQINHKDENPSNNSVGNLEWCTAVYNNNYGTHNQKLSIKAKKQLHNTYPQRRTPIAQYSLDGKLIGIYDGIVTAAIENNLNKSAILHNLRNRSKTSGGYIWKYVN